MAKKANKVSASSWLINSGIISLELAVLSYLIYAVIFTALCKKSERHICTLNYALRDSFYLFGISGAVIVTGILLIIVGISIRIYKKANKVSASNMLFKSGAISLLLAVLTYPIYSSIFKAVCEKSEYNTCTFDSALESSYYLFSICGAFIFIAILLIIIGVIMRIYKKS